MNKAGKRVQHADSVFCASRNGAIVRVTVRITVRITETTFITVIKFVDLVSRMRITTTQHHIPFVNLAKTACCKMIVGGFFPAKTLANSFLTQ